jgi:hypothetical protein
MHLVDDALEIENESGGRHRVELATHTLWIGRYAAGALRVRSTEVEPTKTPISR